MSGWLMVYSGGGEGVRDGGVSSSDWWAKRTDPVLDSASNLYSDLEISVGDSKPSCPTYTVY